MPTEFSLQLAKVQLASPFAPDNHRDQLLFANLHKCINLSRF